MKKIISIILSAAMISGCATTYQGPPPNFTLKGEEAKREYEKFRWDDSAWSQHPSFVRMGHEKTVTKRGSLDPIIDEVSPDSKSKIRKAQGWVLANGVLLTGMLIWVFAGISSNRSMAPEERTAVYAGIGVSLGISFFVVPMAMQDATDQFNQDLKKKFEPGLALRTSF